MNYSFQLTGLQDASGNRFLDYSRFSIPLRRARAGREPGLRDHRRCRPPTCSPSGAARTAPASRGRSRRGRSTSTATARSGPVSADVNGDGAEDRAGAASPTGPRSCSRAARSAARARSPPAAHARGTSRRSTSWSRRRRRSTRRCRSPSTQPARRPGSGGRAGPPPGRRREATASPRSPCARRVPRAPRRARRVHAHGARPGCASRVERLLPGHRRGGRCRAGGRGPRCVRPCPVKGSFSHAGRAGSQPAPRCRRSWAAAALKPGRYRLSRRRPAGPPGGRRSGSASRG